MHSPLVNFEGSTEYLYQTETSERDLEELHPFSPIRKRQTPEPPPKVQLNVADAHGEVLARLEKNKQNLDLRFSRDSNKEHRRCRRSGRIAADDMDDLLNNKIDDNYMFSKQPEIFMTAQRDSEEFVNFSEDLLDFSQTGLSENYQPHCSAETETRYKRGDLMKGMESLPLGYEAFEGISGSVSPTSSAPIRGEKSLGIRDLFEDLERVEKAMTSETSLSDDALGEAQSKLNRWCWLLNWLDSPQCSREKCKPKFTKSRNEKKRGPKIGKPREANKQMKLKVVQQRKRKIVNKIGHNPYKPAVKGKTKLAKKENPDILTMKSRVKPNKRVSKKQPPSKKGKRQAPNAKSKCHSGKGSAKNKVPTITAKFIAEIRKKYARLIQSMK